MKFIVFGLVRQGEQTQRRTTNMKFIVFGLVRQGEQTHNLSHSRQALLTIIWVFSHVTLQLGKLRLTGNFFIECMIISDFMFVNKCLYMYYISINLSLNKLLNDI
jgi:hypothetical protein